MKIMCKQCNKEVESGVLSWANHLEVCEGTSLVDRQKTRMNLPMTGETGYKLFHAALEEEAKKFLAEDTTTKWLSFEEWKAQDEYRRNHPFNRGI